MKTKEKRIWKKIRHEIGNVLLCMLAIVVFFTIIWIGWGGECEYQAAKAKEWTETMKR